jgi:Pyridoxamine 5'-phosphate oxidase
MGGTAGLADWGDVERGAPEIARLGAARLTAARVAMLGTLRRDGSPRISPIETSIVNGRLLVGAMTWSAKAADLGRDPRYVLHSTVTESDSGEGELKLHGLAAKASPAALGEAGDAWWSGQPPGKAVVFQLGIGLALFVGWDMKRGLMTIHRWSPRDGYGRAVRTYP